MSARNVLEPDFPAISISYLSRDVNSIRTPVRSPLSHVFKMSTDNNNNVQSFKLESKGRGSILQEARRFISMRSPEKEMKIQPANECICNRKLMGILCRSCGGVFRGRVRQICIYHPNSRYLMDYEVCPSCKATQLREFEETISNVDMECEKERNA